MWQHHVIYVSYALAATMFVPPITASSRSHLAGIHALRGMAAVIVFLVHLHFGGKVPVPDVWWPLSNYGLMAVDLFFVLSAFSLLYTNERQTQLGGSWDLKAYATKRFFRIIPLFYFMLLVHCLLLLKNGNPPELSRILINLLFIFNFIPKEVESIVWAGWSIGVEMVFYTILPFLMLYVRSLRSAILLWMVASAISAINHVLVDSNPALKSYSYFSFLSHLGVFCAGIMGFSIFRAVGQCKSAKQRWLDAALLCGPALLAFFTFTEWIWQLAWATRMDIQAWGLAFGVTTALLARHPTRFLRHAAFQYLGERSYSIYLTHAVVIHLTFEQLHQLYNALLPVIGQYAFAICAIVEFPLVLAFSEVTYRLVERPGILLGRRLLARYRQADDASVTAAAYNRGGPA
jgi:peptidoglycan/LPS O-acetylase OafA/YrhL